MLYQSKLSKYAFINAKLRAIISNIFSDEKFSQIAKAGSLPEAIRHLHDTPFQVLEEVYARTGDLKLAEYELLKKEIELYHEIEKHVKGDVLEFVRGLTRRYEVDNLKAALRLWFDRVIRQRNIDTYTEYLIRDKIHYDLHVDQIINIDSIEGIIEVLKDTPYSQIIKESASKIEVSKSLFQVGVALDKYFYKQLYEKARKLSKTDFEIIKRLIGVEVDMENISWLVRFRDFYKMSMSDTLDAMIPCGHHLDSKGLEEAFKTGDSTEILKNLISKKYSSLSSLLAVQSTDSQSKLVLLGRLLDQIILYEIKRIKSGYPFTIGIVMAYFVLKKNEIHKVMTLLNAKYYNIEEERIKSVI